MSRFVVISIVICTLLVCLFFCAIVSSDNPESRQIFRIPMLNSVLSFLPELIHSSEHYLDAANHLQYTAHSPSDIDGLFRKAVISSPADSVPFQKYSDYLRARNCCQEQTGLLLEQAVRRNPREIRLYYALLDSLLKQGAYEKAYQYYAMAMRFEAESVTDLIKIMLENGARPGILVQLTPPSKENYLQLMRMLSRNQANHQDWTLILTKLENLTPSETLDIASQALDLKHYEIAREYAARASSYAETEVSARKILNKVDSGLQQ